MIQKKYGLCLGRPFYIMCYRSRVSIVLGDGRKRKGAPIHEVRTEREGGFGKVYEVTGVVKHGEG